MILWSENKKKCAFLRLLEASYGLFAQDLPEMSHLYRNFSCKALFYFFRKESNEMAAQGYLYSLKTDWIKWTHFFVFLFK